MLQFILFMFVKYDFKIRLNELNLNKLVSIIYIIISFVQNAKTKKTKNYFFYKEI